MGRASADGVAHRGRKAGVAGGERLGDEEWVAGRALEELLLIGAERDGEGAHRVARQRRHFEALDTMPPRQLAQHDLQRVGDAQLVVAERHDHECRYVVDPAGE